MNFNFIIDRDLQKKKYKRKRAGLIIAAVLVILIVLMILFSSSGAYDTMLQYLGFDLYDYESESVIVTHEPDSEVANELAQLFAPLLIDNVKLTEFSDTRQVSENYRDAILNFLLNSQFAKYTGNLALLEAAEKEYPHYHITTLIPREDFESTVYQYFGGKKSVKNESGILFRYLDKVKAYTAVGQPIKYDIEIGITSCQETESTFRVQFYNSLDGEISPVYSALIIKREDGTRYIKKLTKVADERVTAPSAGKNE
ncbi:MAG: hypothetical protein GX303_02025 [Clostridiales bacterium]|nr:hypothetical protein [Clostridiales bacterium]